MNALQRLIREHCEATGDSYSDIARRGELARQTVQSLAGDTDFARATPRPDTLDRLAAGMRMDPRRVHYAGAQAAGYNLAEMTSEEETSEDIEVYAALLERMSRRQRRAAIRQAVDLLNETRESEKGDSRDEG